MLVGPTGSGKTRVSVCLLWYGKTSPRVAAPSPRQMKNVFPLPGEGCGYNWATVQRAAKSAILLQKELNSGVVRFTTQELNLSHNKLNSVVADYEKLLQKVRSSSPFYNKICICCAFYRPKANLLLCRN